MGDGAAVDHRHRHPRAVDALGVERRGAGQGRHVGLGHHRKANRGPADFETVPETQIGRGHPANRGVRRREAGDIVSQRQQVAVLGRPGVAIELHPGGAAVRRDFQTDIVLLVVEPVAPEIDRQLGGRGRAQVDGPLDPIAGVPEIEPAVQPEVDVAEDRAVGLADLGPISDPVHRAVVVAEGGGLEPVLDCLLEVEGEGVRRVFDLDVVDPQRAVFLIQLRHEADPGAGGSQSGEVVARRQETGIVGRPGKAVDFRPREAAVVRDLEGDVLGRVFEIAPAIVEPQGGRLAVRQPRGPHQAPAIALQPDNAVAGAVDDDLDATRRGAVGFSDLLPVGVPIGGAVVVVPGFGVELVAHRLGGGGELHGAVIPDAGHAVLLGERPASSVRDPGGDGTNDAQPVGHLAAGCLHGRGDGGQVAPLDDDPRRNVRPVLHRSCHDPAEEQQARDRQPQHSAASPTALHDDLLAPAQHGIVESSGFRPLLVLLIDSSRRLESLARLDRSMPCLGSRW